VCLALLAACGTRIEEELARTSSPDMKLVATLVQVDPGGGATVGFTTDVYVNEAGLESRKHPQFEGYSCGPVSISWMENQTRAQPLQQHLLFFHAHRRTHLFRGVSLEGQLRAARHLRQLGADLFFIQVKILQHATRLGLDLNLRPRD
jgi:hypothetical protein